MKYIVANWKQNMDLKQAVAWADAFSVLWHNETLSNVTVVICPPYTLLETLEKHFSSEKYIHLGGQDISLFNNGPHTGLVGVEQLKDFATYCIIGHSELNENRADSYKKAQLCLDSRVTPIVCTKARDEVIALPEAIYALEDPENISGGNTFKPKKPEDIENIVVALKKDLPEKTNVLYGGSVNSENASLLASMKCVDGVLAGSASLDAKHFFEIVKAFSVN